MLVTKELPLDHFPLVNRYTKNLPEASVAKLLTVQPLAMEPNEIPCPWRAEESANVAINMVAPPEQD